jgi:hypothetical protein
MRVIFAASKGVILCLKKESLGAYLLDLFISPAYFWFQLD